MRERLRIKGQTHPDRFIADKKMISILDKYKDEKPDELFSLDQNMNKYIEGLKKLNLRDWILRREKFSLISLIAESLILLLLSPAFILGLFNNYIPYIIPVRFIRKIKDPQFHSSFKLVMGMITFPLYYILLIILALIFIEPAWLKLAYIISIPLSGIFAFRYYIRLKKLMAKFRYSRLIRVKDKLILQLKALRKDITGTMNKITEHIIN